MRHSMLVPLQLLPKSDHPPQPWKTGDMYYNTTTKLVLVFDGTVWGGLKGAGSEEVLVQPMDPTQDDVELWVDTDDPGSSASGQGVFLPLTGGDLTGPLTITTSDPLLVGLNVMSGGIYVEGAGVQVGNFTPTVDNHLTTKKYVDDLVAGGIGGDDEIVVQTTEPTDPELELWVDLTASGDSAALDQATADLLYVNIGGDAMTGPLTLAADPVNPLEAATKQYVDANAGGGGTGDLDQADADLRYINNTGDTMMGPLVFASHGAIFAAANASIVQSAAAGLVVADSAGTTLKQLSVADPVQIEHAANKGYVEANFARVTVAPVAPPSPRTGDIWIYYT